MDIFVKFDSIDEQNECIEFFKNLGCNNLWIDNSPELCLFYYDCSDRYRFYKKESYYEQIENVDYKTFKKRSKIVNLKFNPDDVNQREFIHTNFNEKAEILEHYQSNGVLKVLIHKETGPVEEIIIYDPEYYDIIEGTKLVIKTLIYEPNPEIPYKITLEEAKKLLAHYCIEIN